MLITLLMPLYSVALAAMLLLSAPWWLLRMCTTARYREGLGERLGRVPAGIRGVVSGKRTVWLHAVSVGEVLAASSLVAELERELGPAWRVVISTTTRTGQQLARSRFGSARVFYFPLDFRFAVRCWLKVLQPELLILTESELWPRLLHECARAFVPVAVVNARISDRTLRRTLRFHRLWQRTAGHVTLWLAQSEDDAARVLRLGIDPARVHNTGNLKYDTRPPRESAVATAIRDGAAGRLVVVAGSTVAYGTTPEEAIVLDAMRSHVWPELPGVLLVLAPRHPERFIETDVLAASFGTTLCATELIQQHGSGMQGRRHERIQERIVVLDTIGDLAAVYRVANVAFVGGSLLPHGGHNPLEPAQFGVPVVMGPHVENFRDIVSHLQAANGIVLLAGTEPEPLGRTLTDLLRNPARAQLVGAHGREVCEQQKGATARTVAALLPLIRRDEGFDALGLESPASVLARGRGDSGAPASVLARGAGHAEPQTQAWAGTQTLAESKDTEAKLP